MTLDATQQAGADRLARYGQAVWEASRADEGTISYIGANHVARAVMALVDEEISEWRELHDHERAQVDTFTAEVERLRGHLAAANYQYDERVQEVSDEMTRREAAEAENATLRAQVAELADEWRREAGRYEQYAAGSSNPHELRSLAKTLRQNADALDAASPTPHTPTKEHQ